MSNLFKCPRCKKKAMSIFRYGSMLPLGLCGHCECVIELSTEELTNMIKRICDRLKCNAEIPAGPRKVLRVVLAEVDDTDNQNPIVNNIVDLTWDVCEDCSDIFENIFTNPEGLEPILSTIKRSKGMKESWNRRRNPEPGVSDDPEDPKDHDTPDTTVDIIEDSDPV